MTTLQRVAILLCLSSFAMSQELVEVTEADKAIILDAHNKYRSNTDPPAADMEIMSYMQSAGETAKTLATSCSKGHDDINLRTPAEFQPVSATHGCGQNVYITTTIPTARNPRDNIDWNKPIASWHDQSRNFKYGTGPTHSYCTKTVGYYTQVVWSATNLVGCAVAVCNKNSPWGTRYPTWYFYVCNYCPSGNTDRTKADSNNWFKPYAEGEPATQCRSGKVAEGYDGKLCTPTERSEVTEEEAAKPVQRLIEVTEEDKATIVNAHNKFRAGVSPEAADMEIMSYLESAGDTAKTLAESCFFKHDRGRDRTPAGFDRCGQNLHVWASSGGVSANPRDDIDWDRAVTSWHNEVDNFQFGNGSTNGKQIGHYTQVVWSKSNLVGCAVALCDINSPFSIRLPIWYLYVCNYCPSGNMQDPTTGNYYSPYALGTPASQCSSGEVADGYGGKLCKPSAP